MSSPSIAVIGGGIAGCSAAWFLRQALGERAALTVYERDAQLGGRLATLDVGGTQVESGGTIIHETNRYLASFVDQLALERVEPHQREEGGAESVGVWDGHRFAFRTHKSALVTRLAAVWRFGVIAPMRLQRSVARGVEQWNQVYELLERGAAFDSPLALCSELGLADLLQKDGRQWLADSGVRGPFVDQYATPVGRIMYGQDVSMNALATSIALAGAGLAGTLFSVGGGNCRVCEGLVRDAGATLQIGTEVAGVSRAGGRFTVQLSDGRSVSHDVIVLATPGGPAALTFSGVELPESALRVRPFQITWATFVKGTPRADYFGLARATNQQMIDQTIYTEQGQMIGTPEYMSPEQAQGEKVDARSDLYSAGVILFEMLSGRPPFEGRDTIAILRQHAETPPPDLAELSPSTPGELVAIAARLLAKKPSERYADVRSLAADLKAVSPDRRKPEKVAAELVAGLPRPDAQTAALKRTPASWELATPVQAADSVVASRILYRREKLRTQIAVGAAVVSVLALIVAVIILFRGPAQPDPIDPRPVPPMARPADKGVWWRVSPRGGKEFVGKLTGSRSGADGRTVYVFEDRRGKPVEIPASRLRKWRKEVRTND